jgi:hypothetical protein
MAERGTASKPGFFKNLDATNFSDHSVLFARLVKNKDKAFLAGSIDFLPCS